MFFFFQAEDGIRDDLVTGVQTCALPISPPREALARRVADALRAEIASGRLKPGIRLSNEVALAKALDISRPTLREAIRVLGREGLLRIKHGIGTFVAEEPRVVWGRLASIRSMTALIRSVGR